MPQTSALTDYESELERMCKAHCDQLKQGVSAVSTLAKSFKHSIDAKDDDHSSLCATIEPKLKAAKHDIRALHKLEKALKSDATETSMKRARSKLDEASMHLDKIGAMMSCGKASGDNDDAQDDALSDDDDDFDDDDDADSQSL